MENNKEITSDTYLSLLNIFTSTDEDREWMNEPFIIADLAIATDAHMIISFKKSLIKKADSVLKLLENNRMNTVLSVMTILNSSRNKSLIIEVDKVKEIFKVNEIDGFTPCKGCKGKGRVKYVFQYENKDYNEKLDCPVCDGIAEKSNLEDHFFSIMYSIFPANIIKSIILACDKLETNNFELVYQHEGNKANIFRIKEIEIIAMPKMASEDQKNIYQL